MAGGWHEAVLVKRLHTIVVWLSICTTFTASDTKAGPFQELFRTLRSAIAHPRDTPRSHVSTQKRKKSDASNGQTSERPTPMPGSQTDVRWAKAASNVSDQKADLQYGT